MKLNNLIKYAIDNGYACFRELADQLGSSYGVIYSRYRGRVQNSNLCENKIQEFKINLIDFIVMKAQMSHKDKMVVRQLLKQVRVTDPVALRTIESLMSKP